MKIETVKMPSVKKPNGFTLIELMVTLSVFAIVVGLAIPSFKDQVNNNRSLILGTTFLEALAYVRSEAVKRGDRVSICPSTDGTTCAGATEWAKGWIAFLDTALTDDAAPVVLPANVLRYWNDLNASSKIDVKSGTVALGFVRYIGSGRLGTNQVAAFTVNAHVEHCKGNNRNEITIGLSGMISSVKVACP